ncbi:MAG: trimethylamine methyltransferase family protein [Candidatus Zixiibacteriota bacterium]
MRPVVRFLERQLIERIISEARDILCTLGVSIHNEGLLSLLSDFGVLVDKAGQHVKFTEDIIDKALKSAPSGFKLYDTLGREQCDFSGDKVHFTPGSAAIYILDAEATDVRKATTADYISYTKLIGRMKYIASQSTAMVPSDVPQEIADSLRLYFSLMFCEKPVVTGAFRIESFDVMKDLQVAIRGSDSALKEKPLTVFSCCPTSPLSWSDVTSQNLVDCARYGIPVEYVAMPLAGFIAPVTLVGTLVQHTAETISGIVLTQLTNPGAPALYGGSPAIFDIRYETTPMGAVETEMIDCAYSEIGKYLGLPTQAYIGLSDAKHLDAQAGLETSMGATLAALSGINSISGPGMIDFENCFSFEKLVVDNEICGMVMRMLKGIEPKEDFPARPHFEELLKEKHLLIADHSRKYLRSEHHFPGNVIERANRARWREEGSKTLMEKAREEVRQLLDEYEPTGLRSEIRRELSRIMSVEAAKYGMDKLPVVDV